MGRLRRAGVVRVGRRRHVHLGRPQVCAQGHRRRGGGTEYEPEPALGFRSHWNALLLPRVYLLCICRVCLCVFAWLVDVWILHIMRVDGCGRLCVSVYVCVCNVDVDVDTSVYVYVCIMLP